MTAKKYHSIAGLLLIIVLCASLLNVQVARADGETPTEPPAATQVATEAAVQATPEPAEATPAPEETTVPSAEESLSQVPEATEVVVLDEGGETVPLATQEAAQIVSLTDPMWCPEGVAPGGAGCSTSFGSIAQLIADMKTNTPNYSQNGVIYFTADATEPLTLTTNSLGFADFQTVNDFNLTLQGGWNGDPVSPSFSGQTNFGANSITVGTSSNPWAGNVTLNAIAFDGVSTSTAITVFTTGQIALSNVDVEHQTSNGARLHGPVVTLEDVTAKNNLGNGILVENASVVTLNNVVASTNGKNGSGSGVFVNNVNPGRLIIIGGEFNNNNRNGIQVANATIYVQSAPTCTGNRLACYSATPTFDNTPPVITPVVTGTAGSSGWYTSNVSVSWSVLDAESGVLSSLGCGASSISSETTGTAFTCSASNNAGLSNSASVTVKIDKTNPVLVIPADITKEATQPAGASVSYSPSASDNLDPSVTANCLPASGSTFALGATAVNCSATDAAGNAASDSFQVTVQDTTPPVLYLPGNISVIAQKIGKVINFQASAVDLVDGSVSVSCVPASGSRFVVGSTTVSCSASDAHGNTATGQFVIQLTQDGAAPVTSQSDSSSSVSDVSDSSPSVVPLVGGGPIDLDCNSVFWTFGVKLSFTNLCDQQTTVHRVDAGNLPGALPDGFSFVMGLRVDILSNSQSLSELPGGSSIQMDFPAAGSADAQFAVLYWNGSEWTEVSQTLSATTDQPGTFVLVKK